MKMQPRRTRYQDGEPALVRLAHVPSSTEPPDDPGRIAGPWHVVWEWVRESDTSKLLVTSCGARYLDDREGTGDALDVLRLPLRLVDVRGLICTDCEL